MKMSVEMKVYVSYVLSAALSEYKYVFITSDVRTIQAIAGAAAGATPAAAGLTSLTGGGGSSLSSVDSAYYADSQTAGATCTLGTALTASSSGNASYLIMCSQPTITAGTVGAILPIDTSGDIPVVINNRNIIELDKIKMPSIVFGLSLP